MCGIFNFCSYHLSHLSSKRTDLLKFESKYKKTGLLDMSLSEKPFTPRLTPSLLFLFSSKNDKRSKNMTNITSN